MKTKKLKEEPYDIETQNSDDSDYSAPDPTDYPPAEKKKKKKKKVKKRNIMQLDSEEKGVSRNPKSFKSKEKQVSDNSKRPGSTNARKRASYKRTSYNDMYDNVDAKFSVMERADKVLARLENEIPYFLKCMLPSNVAHGFWLHLPKKFCTLHLPNHDTSIMLVDEWGNEYKTSYLLVRHGLSAGWRGFSISHRLLKGDILIFHLMAPCKFQVHIVRVNKADVVNAALCLMDMDPSRRGTDDDLTKKDERKRKRMKYVEPFHLDISSPLEDIKGKNAPNSTVVPVADQSASNSKGFCSEVIEGSEVTNRPRSNDLYYPKTSFFRDHALEGVTCR